MTLLSNLFRNKKRFVFLIIIILILGGIWFYRSKTSDASIKTAKIERGDVREELILSGEIKAAAHANLNFLSSGELNFVGVVEGQVVEKGQILATLDSTNAYQTYLQAEADLRRYQASLNNTYNQLQGHETNESYTQIETRTIAETNKDKAYRNFVIAQKNLSNLSLKAPFSGIVTSVTHPYNGINTNITESQIEIVNPETIYFEVNADQTDVTSLNLGQRVNIILDSYPDKDLEGEISFIGYTPKVGEVGTVYEVKVSLTKGTDPNVKIGMSGDAKFVLSEKENVFYLPPNFIKTDTAGKYINLAPKNNKKYIETGVEGEDRTEIKGEVNEGDVVYD